MINITTLLPVRNGYHYLTRNFAKLVSTLGENDELLVIDDGSTDYTSPFVQEYANFDSRIHVERFSQQGLVASLNLGIKLSKNDWVARADVDDTYAMDRIQRQRTEVKSDNVAIFSDYELYSTQRHYLGTIASAIYPASVSVSLVSGQRTAHPSVLFHREAVLESGGYQEEDFPVEDLSLWLRLSRYGNLVSVPLPLLRYQVGTSSISAKYFNLMQAKRIQILKAIGINHLDIQKFWESYFYIFDSYDEYSLSTERKLLLFRDAHLLSNLGYKSLVQDEIKWKFRTWILNNPAAMMTASFLAYEKLKRSLCRLGILP